jgi:uncharacterized protein Yka (UPF0111/DUF47 family)
MSAVSPNQSEPRSLDAIFKEHLENTIKCSHALNDLFLNFEDPVSHFVKIKQLENYGDKLTAEAYGALESFHYSELVHITEDLIKLLDDIIDGLDRTARLIDICQPRQVEEAAHDILLDLQAMIERLQQEIVHYPDNDPAKLRACCNALKEHEKNADLIYHAWRKKQRRALVLSLIEENNWTEILGVLEQTTDAAYHAALVLERLSRYRKKRISE